MKYRVYINGIEKATTNTYTFAKRIASSYISNSNVEIVSLTDDDYMEQIEQEQKLERDLINGRVGVWYD